MFNRNARFGTTVRAGCMYDLFTFSIGLFLDMILFSGSKSKSQPRLKVSKYKLHKWLLLLWYYTYSFMSSLLCVFWCVCGRGGGGCLQVFNKLWLAFGGKLLGLRITAAHWLWLSIHFWMMVVLMTTSALTHTHTHTHTHFFFCPFYVSIFASDSFSCNAHILQSTMVCFSWWTLVPSTTMGLRTMQNSSALFQKSAQL